MKRLLPIIVGIIVGITAGTVMISRSEANIAYGVGNAWNTYNFFEWNEIFTPKAKGQNLYNLVYNKRLVAPERNAIKEIAQKYGLTQEEAKQAADGSISVILNGLNFKYDQLSQGEAAKLIADIQADYEFFSTVFDLEQEIDLSVAPSEIFANGDIFDSGFDLVHDLDVIEEILFVEQTPNTVGGNYEGELDSPYIAQESPAAIVSFDSQTAASLADGEDNGEGEGENQQSTLNLTVGDNQLPVDILDEDICDPADQDYANILAQFDARQTQIQTQNQTNTQSGAGTTNGAQNPSSTVNNTVVLDDNGNVAPAKAGDWAKQWCPGLTLSGGQDISKNLSMLGFMALGDGNISDLNKGFESFSFEGLGTTIHASICLETEFIQKKVSLYKSGQSCIACEVESINEALDKTLSHSLIPNKVTGNLLETAKCKEGYSAGLDMNFILIANPIPTPPNDQIIGDPNILEEWNSFVTEYVPFVKGSDSVVNFEISNATEGASQAQVLAEISKQQDADRTSAQFALEIEDVKADLGNTLVYSQEVLKEIKQMNNYFSNFSKTYADINTQACQEIKKKPNLD